MPPWFNCYRPSILRRRLTGVLFGLILIFTISGALLFPRHPTLAAAPADTIGGPSQVSSTIFDKIKDNLEKAWKHGAAIAFKNAARTFSQRIAYDTAVMLASGGQGQTPLLSWRTLGQSAQRAFDDAAGDFLDTLDTENGYVRLGICQPPRASFQLFVGLTAFDEIKPRPPRCSLSQISQNWETFFANPDNLLQRFGVVFDPRQNDLGVALSIHQNLIKEATTKSEISKLERLYQEDFKPITEKITGFIKTPAEELRQQSEKVKDIAAQDFSQFTGDIIADALEVFTNTLASRLMKRLLQGTIPSPSRLESGQFGLGNLGLGGVEYALQINSTISTPQLVGSTSAVDIISEFSNCPPDPAFYTPLNACTITQKFAQALRKANEGTPLTVKEAIEQGYIDGNLRFALVRASDDQHAPTKAWYLSDLRKLRRARIIPLGWELAAEKFAGTSTTLKQVMEGFSVTGVDSSGNPDRVCDGSPQESIYCGLIDPNWILRAPPAQCRIEAYGQQLEPQGPNRQKTCVDYQHCVAEKADGSCAAWGYCKREKNIWRFSGNSCEFPEGSGVSPWATCMSYRDPAGKVNNFLASSLANYDDGVCSDAASCRWYSAARNLSPADPPKDNYLITGNQNSVNTVDFNLSTPAAAPIFYLKNVNNRKCDPNTEGCTRFLQLANIDNSALGLPPATTYADQVQAAVAAVTGGTFASYEEISSPSAATLRQAPEYLNCYDSDSNNDAPECANYLKMCYENEVGCELYMPRDGSPAVPGKVEAANLCPGECNGLNTYTQTSSFFENFLSRAAPNNIEPSINFIPSTAQVCSSQYVGCNEFTNVEQNERREYYSELRQCVRPEDNLHNTYYTWVGSDLTGYQLKTWQLQATNPADPLSAPFTTDGSGTCELNSITNPDCKEFYATLGSQVVTHYRYESKVIYASASCNRYRATNVVEADCANSNGTWEGGRCYYRAIPNQGKVCPASANGCREYRGPTSGNVKLVMPISTFGDVEPGVNADASPLSGWVGGTNSTESTSATGHSLKLTGISSKNISGLLTTGKQYLLSLWVKGETNSNIFAALVAGGADTFTSSYTITTEWQVLNFGPIEFTQNDQGSITLSIAALGGSTAYFDNIALREIQDTFFVRKNTWVTPNTCIEPQHLRCSAYTTRAGQTVYLTGFESICRNDAIGCRALVDTRNSTTPQALTVTAGDQTVAVPEDRVVFRVYDTRKSCASKFAGCSRVGQANYLPSGELSSWTDVFTVLNPDTFEPSINLTGSPLCSSEQNMCQVFTDANGTPHYFKDPGNRICEYKLVDNMVGYDWYKQGTNERCNYLTNPSFELLSSGQVGDGLADEFVGWRPVSNSGVLEGLPSFNGPQYWGSTVLRIPPTADGVESLPVQFSYGPGEQRLFAAYAWVRVPTGTALNGNIELTVPVCTSVNCQLIPGTTYNINNSTIEYDKWILLTRLVRTTNPATNNRQGSFTIRLGAGLALNDIYVDNIQLIELSSSLTNGQAVELAKIPFAYLCPSNQVSCTAYYDPELTKKSYFYLSNGLDKGLCNGQVSEKEGCLLFNDVSQAGVKPWGAGTTYQSSRQQNNKLIAPLPAQAPEVNNTNLILKVRRDRTCAEWLSCQSESPRFNPQTNRYDTICYALGACNRLGGTDEGAGRCANWLTPPLNNSPLNISRYLERGLDWSSQEYSGYSLSNVYPIETLSQKKYADGSIRLTYLNPNASSYTCGGVFGGSSCNGLGTSCTLSNGESSTCQYQDMGLSGQGPGNNLENTGPKICRAYPQKDSPFPSGIVSVYASPCQGDGCPAQSLKVPVQLASVFKDAYACQEGEVCECSYNRVSYANGNTLFYSLQNSSAPMSYVIDVSEDSQGNFIPVYTRQRQREANIGLRGYCLEKDASRLINAGPDLDQACLTWLPIDVASGEISIYDYSPEAGYTGGNTYYCSEARGNKVITTNYVRTSDNIGRQYCVIKANGSLECGVNGNPNFIYSGGNNEEHIVVTPLSPITVMGIVDGVLRFKISLSDAERLWGGIGAINTIKIDYVFTHRKFDSEVGFGGERPIYLNRSTTSETQERSSCAGGVYGKCSIKATVNWNAGNDSADFLNFELYDEYGDVVFFPATSFLIKLTFYLNELCSEIVQVASGLENKAWTDRVLRLENTPFTASLNNAVNELGFTRLRNQTPYGKIAFMPSQPIVISDGYATLPSSDYITVTTPFSCRNGQCGDGDKPGMCLQGTLNNSSSLGRPCANSSECGTNGICTGYFSGSCSHNPAQQCITNSDCGQGNTCGNYRSMANNPTGLGIQRVQQLFASRYQTLRWGNNGWTDGVSNQPLDISGSALDSLRTPTSTQPGVPAVPIVRAVNFGPTGSIGEGTAQRFNIIYQNQPRESGNINMNTSEAVTVTFYAYNPNGEQMPLREIYVDWGDGTPLAGAAGAYKNHKHKCEKAKLTNGSNNPNYNWGDSPSACVDDSGARFGYFTFTHVYTSPGTFKPRIFVKDNWEWCATGYWGNAGNPCTTNNNNAWIYYPDNIIVTNPQGGGGGYVAGPMTVLPNVTVTSCGNTGGPFMPSSRTYQVTNTGSATMRWTVTSSQPWLTITPSSGALGPGGSATVTAFFNQAANNLAAGTYSSTLTFTNTTNNNPGPVSRTYNLQVLPFAQACAGGGSTQY